MVCTTGKCPNSGGGLGACRGELRPPCADHKQRWSAPRENVQTPVAARGPSVASFAHLVQTTNNDGLHHGKMSKLRWRPGGLPWRASPTLCRPQTTMVCTTGKCPNSGGGPGAFRGELRPPSADHKQRWSAPRENVQTPVAAWGPAVA